MTEPVNTIARNRTHNSDTRKVWSKYDEVHINKTVMFIEDAVTEHGVQGVLAILDTVETRLRNDGIVLGADSYITLFDRIWERIGKEFQFSDIAPLEQNPTEESTINDESS